MKRIVNCSVALLLLLTSSHSRSDELPPITRVRVFIVCGQSNALGRAPAKLISEPYRGRLDDVDYSPGGKNVLIALGPASSQFGPEITLGRDLRSAFASESGTRIAIIKHAAGGTSLIHNWRADGTADSVKDGNLYAGMQKHVAEAFEALKAKYPDAKIAIDGVLWVQGESDTAGARPAYYAKNLETFVKDIRETFGPDVRFVISRFSNSQVGYGVKQREIIRAAQEKVAAGNKLNAFIDTDGFGVLQDTMHFSEKGQESIGKAAAAEFVRLLGQSDVAPAKLENVK